MKITFLEAKMALAKQFGVYDELTEQVIDKAYPKAANFKTHTQEVESIEQYYEALSSAAKNWFGLLKGTTQRELTDFADRKGLTDRTSKTELLILDIDGLPWEIDTSRKLQRKDVVTAAERFVALLPAEFSRTSYVAVASSNFGRKPGLRMHLHFLLNAPVQPEVLRGIITMLNFDVPYIDERLTLTPAGRQIKYSVDPCMADNSRIVYIAPPIFGNTDENPFTSNADRIVQVDRMSPLLDLTQLIQRFNSNTLLKVKEKRLKELTALAGIEYDRPKTVSVTHRGQTIKVLQNPEQCSMTIAEINDQYVRYNVNGGDSNAYWVWMDNPEIVYSFKPDEMPFRFKTADSEAYQRHMEQFGKQIERAAARENENGHRVMPMLVLERSLDALVTVEYDPFHDVVRSHHVNGKEIAENWMKDKGAMMPDPIPAYSIQFDPTSSIGHDPKERILNTYAPSELALLAPVFEGDPLTFGDAFEWMLDNAPTCCRIISNMVGDDAICFEQFINWFAFMIQRREKPETAWVVHGVEGTGKGLFIKRIAKPLLGEKYVTEKKLRDIADDKFNGYMEDALLLFIDEFNMNESSNAKATANLLKNQITETTLSIRKMQQNQVNRKTYFGMIFASNDIDAMRLSPTDRRYNVCPRQETPLKAIIPDINARRSEYDRQIADELPKLMSMLQAFQIEEHRVRTPIDNEAKTMAAEAGMTTDETFFTAVRNGNLDFFEPLATLKIMAGVDLAKTHQVRNIALEWLKDALLNNDSRISKQDMKLVYEFMTGFSTNDISFGRKCKQNGIRDERFKVGPARIQGFRVKWIHSDIRFVRELLESSSSTAPDTNVVNIKA